MNQPNDKIQGAVMKTMLISFAVGLAVGVVCGKLRVSEFTAVL
jgi:hypothetical protein